MPSWLRRAGFLPLEDGRTVTWTVAEGRRGRRWREAVTKPDQPGIRHSLLLETDPSGWFSHLELSTEAGLLTLHPEGDGTVHGNVVSARGVEHVRGLEWEPHGIVLVDGSIVCRLAAFPGLGSVVAAGSALEVLVLRITRDLRLLAAREAIERPAERRWVIGGLERIAVDAAGLLPSNGESTWPLEEPG